METQAMQFHIKQESYEGPIEVLLELIEKRKVFVNDISLALVTDDFIAYIQNKGMQPDSVASFLSVAATLLLIKARSLLPNLELTTEESESISDLKKRVALYQLISESSKWLADMYGKKILFVGAPRENKIYFTPDDSLDVNILAGLIEGVIVRVPPVKTKEPVAHVFKTISIREVIETLHDRIERALSVNFDDIIVHYPDGNEKQKKVYVIVSFLGMLELVRNGFIDANQDDNFQNIRLEKQEKIEPVYNKESSYE